jgi:DNA uptake protein ComE-like DNA-binding protein
LASWYGIAVSQYPHPPTAGERFRRKAWLLLCVPAGLTTWAAFLYIGIRARRARWLAWTAVYVIGLVVWILMESPAHPDSTRLGVGAVAWLLTWIGGGVHAIVISNDAVRRIQARSDPALDAARTRIERRAQGRHLLATQPALAREAGVGRPDVPGADDYGLVDVNHASADALSTIPGVTRDLAHQITAQRDQVGGFSSIEDLETCLNVAPGTIDQMRETAVFISG